jgi:hypothetical protein
MMPSIMIMKGESYVESLHEVIQNCNWQDDTQKDWGRDGNYSERRHDLFVMGRKVFWEERGRM